MINNRVFISGCARTRTTLLQRLFCAFDCVVIPGESALDVLWRNNIAVYKSPQTTVVIKRSMHNIFSCSIPFWKIAWQLFMIRRRGVRVVVSVRNEKAVKASWGGYVDEKRWRNCERQQRWFSGFIDLFVDTDKIMESQEAANAEQGRIAEILGLRKIHKWSEYPDFVPDMFFRYGSEGDKCEKRPLQYKISAP